MEKFCFLPIFKWITFVLLSINIADKIDMAHGQKYIFDGMNIIPDNYNSKIRPQNPNRKGPLNVTVSIYVNDILKVDEEKQSFEVDMVLDQRWFDTRLNLANIEDKFVITDADTINRFWLPDLFFINGLSVDVIDSLNQVERLTISKNGMVNYVGRLNSRLSCYMNLQNYPHDYQYCRFLVSTLIYNSSELFFTWDQFMPRNRDYFKFYIRHWYTADCFDYQKFTPENSCIAGTLKLVRRLSYYIIRYYLMTGLCMCFSFGGFWLPVNAWPARVTIIIVPMLTVINIDISMNDEIGVNYVVSLHWWIMWIQAFICLELYEYGFAIAWAHFVVDKKEFAAIQAKSAQQQGISTINPVMVPNHVTGYYFGNKGWYARWGGYFDKLLLFFYGTVPLTKEPFTRNKIDYIARLFFPIVFIIFVFIYSMCCFINWSYNYYLEY